jgi:N-acyl-D-aspartate/D-glutamate deacylase
MLDIAIRGGTVVDGTGAPGVAADVGVRDGRVVAVGTLDEPAHRTIDAHDLVVAPGFVDLHTHYDAQAFWDPTLSPSPLHGVTTVVAGNCGFSIAPLAPEDGDYLMRMLSRVEGMPLEALEAGVPWDWRTTADFLDRLEGRLTPNTGFLVGHSALRRAVLHDEANTREAKPEEVAAMVELLRAGLAAGGLGFSSTWSTSHNDHRGDPVPSRAASREELVTLAGVVGKFPGTTLEFIPAVGLFDDQVFELMAEMSRRANRPLNWNLLQVYGKNTETVTHQLAGSDLAASLGGRVLALTLPDSFRMWLNLKSGFVLDVLPGWDRLMALPDDEKLAMLADPAGRAEMDRLAQSVPRPMRGLANWGEYTLAETTTPAYQPLIGKTFNEIARQLDTTAWDALADIVVADRLRTVIANQDKGQDDASWEARVAAWRDPRTIVGASDAGAHLDMIDSFSYATALLGHAVRERGLLPIEEAISLLTDAPARLYGLTGRGRVAVGGPADLVVLDPDTVGPGPVATAYDLPAGAGRIVGGAFGIHHVVVNGAEVVDHGEFTDARPGTVLRSGTHSETVTAAAPV